MHTQTDDVIEIYWDSKFFQYSIAVKLNLPSAFSGYQKWDVTNDSFWTEYINLEIIDISIGWETVTENLQKDSTYPQDITIEFSNTKKIFVSAAEFKSENATAAFGFSDNLLITNNEDLARQVKMIL